ncbi:hypothetical protein DKX38_014372 [Salix brachista]|uniref:Uncharacterized protein n=1 Tax=Salix brachista TaxID=2182728 RepID=A0A5N5LFY3_9ROSI|nr:hypothetical protein DKX38_014372 [Salix brachista]
MEGSQKPTTEPPYTFLAYQDPRYWNERFSKEERYEWTHFIVLVLVTRKSESFSCGHSQFCEEIYRDGITEITCIDLSAVGFEKMQKRVEAKGNKGLLFVNGGTCCPMVHDLMFWTGSDMGLAYRLGLDPYPVGFINMLDSE